MRFLLKVEFPVETGNAMAKDGSLGKITQSILDDLKPEAAYFLASNAIFEGKLVCFRKFSAENRFFAPKVRNFFRLRL